MQGSLGNIVSQFSGPRNREENEKSQSQNPLLYLNNRLSTETVEMYEQGLPWWSVVKDPPTSAGDTVLTPWSRKTLHTAAATALESRFY